MKTSDALFKLAKTSRNTRLNSLTRKNAFSSEINAQIRSLTFQIKDNLSIDYCKQLEFKEVELDILNKLVSDFIKDGSNHFDDHFIQLLCWNIYKLKPITKIENGRKIKTSFMEFQPGIFDFKPITKKLFQLFDKFDDSKEKIAAALMMVYLNNYQHASIYFIEMLKQYLKSIKFSRNLNLFFDVSNAGTYGRWRIYSPYYKSFIRRIGLFQIRSSYFHTKYFQDAWYYWMKNRASVTNEAVIDDLPCKFFEVCTDAEKLLILSRIIVKNKLNGKNIKELYKSSLEGLFPTDPLIPENWIFNCSYKDLNQLISASNILQKTFKEKPIFLSCEKKNNEIKIYRY